MAGTTAPAGAGDRMNDAFSSHTYQLLYRCRGNFSSPTTFGQNVLKIDWGFKLGLAGGVAVSRAARDPPKWHWRPLKHVAVAQRAVPTFL
jgi:hypothetical protein